MKLIDICEKVTAVKRKEDDPKSNARNFVVKNMPTSGTGKHEAKGGQKAKRSKQKRAWKKTAFEGYRGQRIKDGTGHQDVKYVSLEDPTTGEEVEVGFSRSFNYDSGDVGYGVGPGKSPYQPEFEFDSATVAEPFTFMGKSYQAGEEVDLEQFVQYMTPGDKQDLYNADDSAWDPQDDY